MNAAVAAAVVAVGNLTTAETAADVAGVAAVDASVVAVPMTADRHQCHWQQYPQRLDCVPSPII